MNDEPRLLGHVALTHLGVMRAHGPDAVAFLQGQLTNDVTTLGLSTVRLAGFCSAKGRLQASFLLWKAAPDEVLLACAASVLPATLKRLKMFVLRAKCNLTDASADVRLFGSTSGSGAPADELGVWQKRDDADGTVIRLPDVAGLSRCIAARRPEAATFAGPDAATADPISLDTWRWLEVRSGIPTIEAATVDQFVPQMLNYELLGAVDFQKGCYPGQEIVARSQYRGTIKRRTFLFDCDEPPTPGQEVFLETDPGQPAGMVVNAAPAPGGGWSALIEMKLSAVESGILRLGGPEGVQLRQVELPYALPAL